MTDSAVRRIQNELRFLKLYALVSPLVVVVLGVAAVRAPRREAFDVLDVKRINGRAGQPP